MSLALRRCALVLRRRASGHGGSGHGHADSGSHAHSSHGHGYDTQFYTSVPPPQPSKTYEYIGTALGATMWFWVFWRAKHDLPHLLGFHHPWDHMEEHHHEEPVKQHA